MAGQVIAVDTIPANAHGVSITSAPISLFVLRDVTLGTLSTSFFGINGVGSGNDVTIFGDVFAPNTAIRFISAATSVTIGATGSVTGGAGNAIVLGDLLAGDGASVVNAGDVSSRGDAVVVRVGESVIRNSGEITSGSDAVVTTGGRVKNTGLISGSDIGVDIANAATITNGRNGVIEGGDNAILLEGAGDKTIVNAGEISSESTAIAVQTANAGLTLTNSGTIIGGSSALYLSAGSAMIVNSGLISGDVYLFGDGNSYDGTHGRLAGALYGGSGADAFTGGEGQDRFFGEDGSDSLTGDGGDDRLDGGAGFDVMAGGDGNDRFVVSFDGSLEAPDVVLEDAGGGVDRVFASVDYALGAHQEIEYLIGLEALAPAFAGFTPTGLRLTGNAFANHIIGTGADDALNGDEGADTLNGGEGADLMRGDEGDDRYFVDDADDQVVEIAGDGHDRVLTEVSYTLGAGQEIELLKTVNGAATNPIDLVGNGLANTIIGNDGANTINGRGGADVMRGRDGADTYYVDNAGDTVREAAGDGSDTVLAAVTHTLGAGQEIEKLKAVSAAATTAINLSGNEYANAISGNAGANTISGKAGNDTLSGLGGRDVFVFDTALPGNVDLINDFTTGVGPSANADGILLDDAIFTALATGLLAASAFANNTATTAGHRIIYNTTSGALFYDADGNGARAAVQFATLANAPAGLSNADFLVI